LQKRVGKVDPVQGLEAVKFTFEDQALDNGVHNELNKCFCREPSECTIFINNFSYFFAQIPTSNNHNNSKSDY
jgi:hypothetical protein